MNAPEVFGILAAPSREISLKAVSLALLRVHANHEGVTWAQIAKLLECSVETVTAARDEKNLLSFDCIARLGYFFPAEFRVVRQLWENAPEQRGYDEELADIVRRLDALRARAGERGMIA